MLKWKSYLPHLRTILEGCSQDSRNNECFTGSGTSYLHVIDTQKESLIALFESLGTNLESDAIETYLDYCIHHEIPYLYVSGELANVAKSLLGLLASEQKWNDISQANDDFLQLEYQISEVYYRQFLRKIAVKNHIRLSHLAQLVEKHLMIHYQHHLEWMLVLITYLDGTKQEYSHCELNHQRCSFGQWLHNPTIPYISNTSHFTDIQNLHILLHELADHILTHHASSEKLDHKMMIQLLQRLDYTSLEIGNEIAIINDMLIIGEYAKDPLTGLLGRRLFDKIVMGQIEIAKATESECTLIMCDLDHFKDINDRYGHLAGDIVIQDFAELLQKRLRKSDFIFRFGGEEFFILLPSTKYNEAFSIAQTICSECALHIIEHEEFSINYTVSIGVSGVNTHDLSFVTKETINQYVQTADTKLYIAKQNGRNQVV